MYSWMHQYNMFLFSAEAIRGAIIGDVVRASLRRFSGATLVEINDAAHMALFNRLNKIGLLNSPENFTDSNKIALARLFALHYVSHTVGLDVHDPWGSPWVLEKDMYFTIEPGCYFNQAVSEVNLTCKCKKSFLCISACIALMDTEI